MARINNKEEIQKQKRNKHKSSLKRQSQNLERNEATINEGKSILIVCEGVNTEPDYFKEFTQFFRLFTIKIKVIGVGRNTISLIEQTEKIVKKEDYDQVWCVFDHDPKPDIPIQSQNFNNAIQKAKSLGYKVAYSNQAFEYWLILHFKDEQGTPMNRADYYDEINKYINLSDDKYENNKKISKEMFIRLQEIDENTQKTRQNLAIQRAKRIMKYWEEIDTEHSNPAKEESSTTVYQLVEELLSYARTK